MSETSKATQGSAAAADDSLKFKNMNPAQKVVFVGKVCVFFLSMGFAYPNIFVD